VFETDQGTEEDDRNSQSMGVIRKKTASRGTEAGTKYHCDICSADVTSTVWKFFDCLLDRSITSDR
jgi:transcriptional adapter 2-alpha